MLGICFVTNKPGVEGYISVSIVPQERTGAWDDDTLEIAFENLVADEFEEGVSEEEALDQVVAAAGIEPENIQIVPAKFNPVS